MGFPVRKIDVFAGVNSLLFLILCVFRYHARFIEYRGAGHIEEFFIYAGIILAGILFLWWTFRDHAFDTSVLVLLQAGILMHFAGAFVPIEAGRLYDAHLFGIRYDKYVHVVNAFAVAFLMGRLFQIQGIPLTWLNAILLVLAVLGLGAIVEMVEYAVVLTVESNGVGGYDNNMQDLLGNLCGSVIYVLYRFGSGGRLARNQPEG
jgi:hypothetical protein